MFMTPGRKKNIAGTTVFVGMLVLGIGTALWTLNHQLGAQVTEGTVVALNEKVVQGKEGESRFWVPVIEYQVNGKKHMCKGLIGRGPTSYAVGEKVDVTYQPRYPEAGRLDTFAETWLASAILLPAGIVCTILSVFLLRWARAPVLR
jgi:Protein of unknown function (DUF3592)